MKDSKKLVFIGVAALFACQGVSAQNNREVLSGESGKDYICTGDIIEDGYVISGVIRDEKLSNVCPAGGAFQLSEVAAASTLTICDGSPIPDGWVVIGLISPSSSNCAGRYAYTIKNTAGLSQIDACLGTPIPGGWVITSITPNSSVCLGVSSAHLVNSSPPPPPPPPAIPKAPTLHPIVDTSEGHIVSWTPATDYPDYALRFVVERSVDGGKWKEVKKGSMTSWEAKNVSPGTYSYRVRRITGFADGQWSGVMSITEGGF